MILPDHFQYIEIRKAIHIEIGRLTGLLSRNVTLTFDREFEDVPIGALRIYRMKETQTGNGKWKEWDVLYYFPVQNWLTAQGFQLVIDNSENLSGVVIRYEFKEIES